MAAITILTQIPSPYQVEFFNSLSGARGLQINVVYETRSHQERKWRHPKIQHCHCFLEEGGLLRAEDWMHRSQFVVFGSYRSPMIQKLMEIRQRLSLAWAFWGERPGANSRSWVGRILRASAQQVIRRSKVPIWGIGEWAVEGYRREIGSERLYINVPYFSDLSRYQSIHRLKLSSPGPVRFLFSGSLIQRKGVDLLACAFARLIRTGIDARLTVVGSGELEGSLRRATEVAVGKIKFSGFQQWEELPSIYTQSDVLVAPSRYDGWGLTIPEGLAAGMPVIATNRMGAAVEMITDQNGWIIPAGDIDALYDAMRCAVSQQPELRDLIGARARETSRAYSLDSGIRRFHDAIYRSMVACAEIGLGC